MSLWSDYHKETEGSETIETEFGFVRFNLNPPSCVIHDLFVAPEFRLQGKGTEIMNSVTQRAKDAGCDTLWSKVTDGMFCLNESLAANLHYGFRIVEIVNHTIIMSKYIGGSSG